MGCGSSKNVIENNAQDESQPTEDVRGSSMNNNRVINKDTTNYEVIKEENDNLLNAIDKPLGLKVGDRVHVRGYVGTVKFQGKTKLGEGQWIGIELDKQHPQGNDGAFQDTSYFTCKPQHGLLVRPNVVFIHDKEFEKDFSNVPLTTVVFIQNKMRRLLAKIRLKKLQERSGNEKRIEKHVMNTPSAEESSPNRLGLYLTKPFDNDRDKAYAIYKWLTLNVAYDVDGFFGRGKKKSCIAEDVLQSKLSVCAGYANLFESMGKAAGLDIHVVAGYAKGYGHEPGQRVEGTNHAWNALQIDSQWYLSDATWGAGHVGNDLLFHRNINNYRFLMDPEYSILDHLPEDNKWQFLENPVTKNTFASAAVMSGAMYEMGIELLTHEEISYSIDSDSIEMKFYCPGKKMVLKGALKDKAGKDLSGGRERVQMRSCGINEVKMRAQFPASGTYSVDIFVKAGDSWSHGMNYVVKTTKGCGQDKGGYPQISSHLYDSGFDIISPHENIETKSGKADILMESNSKRFQSVFGNIHGETAKEKKLIGNLNLCYATQTDRGFCVKIDTPGAGNYSLNLFAKQEDGKSVYLCKYQITSLDANERFVAGFPRLSDDFNDFKLQLLEPLENIVTSDGRSHVKIKGEDLSTMYFNCHLKVEGDTKLNLQPNQQLTFVKKTENVALIRIDAPVKGLYTFNVFGNNDGSSTQKFLCSYKIYNDNNSSRAVFGFPRISQAFHNWGIELIEPERNIHAKNGEAQIVLKSPENVNEFICNLKKGAENFDKCCSVKENDDKKVITLNIPTKGLFNLNVFGKKDNENNSSYLMSFLIYSDKE